MTTKTRRKVTRNELESLAFTHHTQIVVDNRRNSMETRVDGVTYWAPLGVIW